MSEDSTSDSDNDSTGSVPVDTTQRGLSNLEKFFIEHSKIPDGPDEAYVVDHFVDHANSNFRCLVSTRTLLRHTINRKVLSASSKATWEGLLLTSIGTTDQDQRFHLYATLLSKDERAEDFEFGFSSIKTAVKDIYNYEMKPSVFICEPVGAIRDAARNVFRGDIFIRLCWFAMKKALMAKLTNLVKDKAIQNFILSDVDILQLCQNPDIFDRASKLFLQKYNNYPEFCVYFDDIWLKENRNWYEGCTAILSPSTNNALESWSAFITKEKFIRSQFTFIAFLDSIFIRHLECSEEYMSGAKTVVETPTIGLCLFRESYDWARLNQPLKSSFDTNGSKYYIVSAGAESKAVDWNLVTSWTTFDRFKAQAFTGWKIIWEANWRNSICNCPDFMRKYICKHIVGIAIHKNLIEVPVGQKRKLGA